MNTIVNPITKKGKVTCIHYYEQCLWSKWYCRFIAIFVHEDKIYLYKDEYEYNDRKHNNGKSTLIEFGDIDPLNMTKAIEALKKNI